MRGHTTNVMRSKPGLILQHGDDGPLARLGEWLSERELPFIVHRVWEEAPPDPQKFGFVVSLGSERSVADSEPGWIGQEIAALRQAAAAEVPVLGLCFGGQALSVALGGGVRTLDSPEIGWIPVVSHDAAIPSGPWLQYHYQQMLLPSGAQELARSPAGSAAFRSGPHLGVQFHPEADGPLLDRWARTDSSLSGTGITPSELADQSALHADRAREQAFRLFDAWLSAASGAPIAANVRADGPIRR